MTLKKQNLTTTYEFNISTYSIITYFLVLTILSKDHSILGLEINI